MEIRVLTSNSTRGVLEALAHKWERARGNKVALTWDSAKAMLARIREGEKGDIVVLTEKVVDELAATACSGARAAGASQRRRSAWPCARTRRSPRARCRPGSCRPTSST